MDKNSIICEQLISKNNKKIEADSDMGVEDEYMCKATGERCVACSYWEGRSDRFDDWKDLTKYYSINAINCPGFSIEGMNKEDTKKYIEKFRMSWEELKLKEYIEDYGCSEETAKKNLERVKKMNAEKKTKN